MKTTLFSKAIELQKYLEETGTTHNKIHFEFQFPNGESILSELFIEANKTLISCTCVHGSVNYEAICSHKLAVIFYMLKKQMRKLKAKW